MSCSTSVPCPYLGNGIDKVVRQVVTDICRGRRRGRQLLNDALYTCVSTSRAGQNMHVYIYVCIFMYIRIHIYTYMLSFIYIYIYTPYKTLRRGAYTRRQVLPNTPRQTVLHIAWLIRSDRS